MIFRSALFVLLTAKVAAKFQPGSPMRPIQADSTLGNKLLSQARRLNDAEGDFSWVAGYSIKFQGCHSSLSWNEEADGDEDVRVYMQRLVRFRLCPSGYCDNNDAYGCSDSMAGEYVIDLDEFVEAYIEAQMNLQEYNCEKTREVCEEACDGDDDANDDEVCEQQCFNNQGMGDCLAEDEEEEFNVAEYSECAQADFEAQDDDGDVEYFIGPYCANNGASVYLGLFTDDTCTVAADYGTYEKLSGGVALPYAAGTGNSLVGLDCISCKEPADENEQNQNDQQDADEVIEVCEQVYEMSAKCEANLAAVTDYASDDACNFIKGIQITREDGSVVVQESASKAAGAFIGIFAVATILLGAYVYYLKSKLDRSRINLGSE